MRTRVGCVLIEDRKIALIERHRAGRHYFTFPGGGVDEGETYEETATREMLEELGLRVKVIRPIAMVHFKGNLQPYFLVEKIGGEFGTGTGDEYGEFDPLHGTYNPLWLSLEDLLKINIVPREIAELVAHSLQVGWPEETVIIFEATK